MKCRNCGCELRKGLSFCHKCGTVVSNTETSENHAASNPKKKSSSCLLVIAIFVGILWLIGIIGSRSVPESHENYQNNSANNITEEKVIRYHKNQGINNLIAEYNNVSEVEISPSMVQNGAYDFSANISVNDVWVQIYNSSAGMFVDYSAESESDSNIFILFKGFSKALDNSLGDESIDNAWKELRTEKYTNYNNYDVGKIKATYSTQKLDNGCTRYLVKTGLQK